jgi:uncharacterized membrane protein required for colicin V production
MIVTILATILILVIAYFQSRQGVFSALIMTILTAVCAAAALNYYEVVGEAVLYSRQGAYADGAALIALFVLPLLVLRVLFDLLLRGNVSLGLWGDRAVGGALGCVTGMILIGMLLVIMQMLPYSESVLGYRPYDDSLQRSQKVWPFCPDDFAVGLGRTVSAGALAGEGGFDERHPDLLLECFCARNTAGRNGGVQATPESLKIYGAYEPTREQAEWVAKVPVEASDEPGTVSKVLVLCASVDRSAADEDKWCRLPGTHFRLLDTRGRSHYPVAYLKPDIEKQTFHVVAAKEEDGRLQRARLIFREKLVGRRKTVYWVYRVDEKAKPSHLIFRRVARQKLRAPKAAAPAPPKPAKKSAAPKKPPPKKPKRPKPSGG